MNTKLIKESKLYNWQNDYDLSKLINIFVDKVDIRFVGGCLRDILLGLELKDIDLAIDCEPYNTIKILKENKINYLDNGLEFGTVIALINNIKYEITSLRKDIRTDGRFAKVEYTNNWDEDSLRRDFTINAIYLSPNGNIFDPFNGTSDIKNQKILFIGDSEKRIKEDYLRIIRFYRFLGIFKYPIYREIDLALANNNFEKMISIVSNNKIKKELEKMIKNKYCLNSFLVKFKYSDLKYKNLLEKLESIWLRDNYNRGMEVINICKKIINVNKYN